ncbi:FMN-dependent NADH-azoreductase [Luteimicrobium album]|uniref:FMN dependent NADH:quinone oxidoreductase n=1 Tax=Luteimicrobium album TaxID=1054550 RepID=A0ABQ6I1A3_9MICO|nr:NAD(P)H-dependent oxidoreductase [Luteimicrobium album]GMA23550.1 FMN-dependent NADH-azoreductase [Luteimicrobium album]
MPTLLRLDSSYDDAASVSRLLTDAFTRSWLAGGPGRAVVEHDLRTDPVPPPGSGALHWAPGLRGPDALVPADASAAQARVLDELLAADAVVIGAPLYNYGLPATLKAWVDQVHVPGTTAPFGEGGPKPLRGRPAVVVATRGTAHDGDSEAEGRDHALPVLRLILGEALGMDVHVVVVDRTLSLTTPAFVDDRERFEKRFAAATTELEALAAHL